MREVTEASGCAEGSFDVPELHYGTNGIKHFELDVTFVEIWVTGSTGHRFKAKANPFHDLLCT